MARPREHGKRICAYPVEFYEEDQETVDGIEDLRAKDRLEKGPFIRKMAREYVQRHSPGNNQLILDNYSENPVPFSIAAQEKLQPGLGPDPVDTPTNPTKVWTLPDLEAMKSEELERLYRDPGTGHADRAFIAYVTHKRYYHFLGDCYCGRHHTSREA